LKPNYSPARQWYSSLLAAIGQTNEALVEAKRARDLDPFSPIIVSHPAWVSYLSRNAEDTIKEARQTLKLDQNFFPARRYLALGYDLQGKYDDAIAEFQKANSISRSTMAKAELGYAYAKAGRRGDALRMIDELRRSTDERHVSPFHFALIHIGLGENDRAIELLNQAIEERSARLVWIQADPRFDGLRKDKRFDDLLTRIGFPR
jgi:tetratricopeptide (TPR) repeat protein